MAKIYVIHENDAWVEPLRAAFGELGLALRGNGSSIRACSIFSAPPPQGVFYNRMSASSHTRGHRYAPEYTACVAGLAGRRMAGASSTIPRAGAGVSRSRNIAALSNYGVRTPRTLAAVGRGHIIEAAKISPARSSPSTTAPARSRRAPVSRCRGLSDYVNGDAFEIRWTA